MEAQELPLQTLFTRLQEAGLPLGVDEYQLAIKGLQAGFGLPDNASLARLCKTLWVKSQEDQPIFDYHFEQLFSTSPKPTPSPVSPQYLNLQAWQKQVDVTTQITEQTNRYTRFGVIISILLGVLCLVILWQIPDAIKLINPLPQSGETSPPEAPPPIEPDEPLPPLPEPKRWPWWGILLAVIVAGGGIILARWIFKRIATQQKSQSPVFSNENESPIKDIQAIQDEVRLAQVMQQVSENKPSLQKTYVVKNSDYFPVTSRQLKQGWRYLRRSVREGPKTELDIEATVNQIGQQGMLMEAVMVPPRINKTELLLLIDHDGSMVPFHALSRRLAETAVRAGRLGNAGIYYFHNCPVKYLFHDVLFQNSESIGDFLNITCSPKTTVLIFSDGGAARGGFNPKRLQLTADFLGQLRQRVKYVAWLNPLSQKRWTQTTAGAIADLIPMFEVSRQGFQSSIDVLRGRHQPEAKELKSLI